MEKFRAAAWTTPAAYVLLAIALSQYTLWVDERFPNQFFEESEVLKITSPEGARVVLGTIATSMLAVAGVSFSSIMVTMTLASQQFGPRLLRNFLKDRASQSTLGVLMGTFVYCLFIMKGVRSVENDLFVPQVSIITSMVLAMIGLGFFIHFIQHILNEIQAEQVVADAYRGLESSITAVFPGSRSSRDDSKRQPSEWSGWEIEAGKTGYVQAINFDALCAVASKHDLVLRTLCRAGSFVSKEQSIVECDRQLADDDRDALAEPVRGAFYVGSARTPEQDYEYGFRQLVEVALRALSPGINDPFTAMDCVDYLGAGLRSVFSRALPEAKHLDEEGSLRVISQAVHYEGLVCAAVNQIRQASRQKCDVSCRLLEMLAQTARASEDKEQQKPLLAQADLVHRDSLPEMFNEHDRQAIEARYRKVVESCHLLEAP